jgi:hypothetical protein
MLWMIVCKFINLVLTQHTDISSYLICGWANQPETYCDVLHMKHEETSGCCVKIALINLLTHFQFFFTFDSY